MGKAVGIKLNDQDHASWSAQADKEGLTLTAWIRSRVNLSMEVEPQKVNLSPEKAPKKVNLKVETDQKVNPPIKKVNPCKAYGRHDYAMVDGVIRCRRCGSQTK